MSPGHGAAAPMNRFPQPLTRLLATDPTLAAWDARWRREAALTATVRRHLPRPLAERIRVVDASGAELVLAAEAGAIAAVARQRAPDLIAALRREGYEFTGIRMRVQVRIEPPLFEKSNAKQMDRFDLRPLTALARSLPAGPLKAALDRFVRRAG
jgi:Dna[CI] antecedent, DciA